MKKFFAGLIWKIVFESLGVSPSSMETSRRSIYSSLGRLSYCQKQQMHDYADLNSNARDLTLSDEQRANIKIIEVSNIMEVLQEALDNGKKKTDLLKKLSKEISWK